MLLFSAPITCHKCNAGYTCNAELKAHLKWCTGNFLKRPKQRTLKPYYDLIDGNFHCKICPRTYNSKKNFSFHYQSTHKDNKTCKICDRTFACYINFRRHVKVVHEKIKSFHCEYPGCGKSFGTKYILNNHKNTHTGWFIKKCTDQDFHLICFYLILQERNHTLVIIATSDQATTQPSSNIRRKCTCRNSNNNNSSSSFIWLEQIRINNLAVINISLVWKS